MGGFMCLSDMSACELLLLTNDIALSLSKNLDADETALLSAFLRAAAAVLQARQCARSAQPYRSPLF